MASDTSNPPSHSFNFDRAMHRLEAIKKASYRFLADYHVRLSEEGQHIVVTLVEKAPGKSKRFNAEQLPTEVLDQDLREQVLTETQAMRDLILAQAFAGLPLVDPIGDTADFRDDPKGIVRPDRRQGD